MSTQLMFGTSPTFAKEVAALAIAACAVGLGACSTKSADRHTQLRSADFQNTSTESLSGPKSAAESPDKPRLDPALVGLKGPHFTAFDLLVNRPLAHRIDYHDGSPATVVDASTPDFVQYIQGNHANDWMLDKQVDGRQAAAVKARKANMWVPAMRPGAEHHLRMRVFNPARWTNELTVAVNGTPLDAVSLEKGWQTVTLDIGADENLRGDNQLAMTFSNLGRIDGHLSGGAVAWVELGRRLGDHGASDHPSDQPPPAAPARVGDAGNGHESDAAGAGSNRDKPSPDQTPAASTWTPQALPMGQGELRLDGDHGLAWYVWVPTSAHLALQLQAPHGCGVTAKLFVEGDDGGIVSATSVTRNLVAGRGGTQNTAVDLSEWDERVGRLELRASSGCSQPVTVQRAALVVPGAQPNVPTDVDPPKRVVFWMIDTLRADHLPVDFDTDVQAPNLVQLAEEGASFKLAYVQGNESRTSHAALFTSQYPSRNGLVGKGVLHRNQYLMAEALQDNDYRTGCQVANGYVSRTGGFAQGWDYYVNNLRDGWRIDAKSIAGQGANWAKKNADKPFFLYLGTIDPHVTYRAHGDLVDIYQDEPYHGAYANYVSGGELGKIKGGRHVSARDRERIENLYKTEITFNDQAFGELRESLEKQGLWEDTMVVVTGDHGDEFWEHGSVGHGHSVYQELVHVPLLIRYPPLIPAGTTVESGVDILDIYPTILDAIGAERPDALQGKSLLPLVYNMHGGYPEPAIATQYLVHYAMQMQQWKLLLERGDYELFDHQSDPLERTDVADEHPLASRFMLDAMGWFRAHRKQWDKASWGVPSKVTPGFLDRIASQ